MSEMERKEGRFQSFQADKSLILLIDRYYQCMETKGEKQGKGDRHIERRSKTERKRKIQ